MAKVIETNIESLVPDNKNFNKGTEYGQHLIEESLRKFGAGRSILLDKNNSIISGNKTMSALMMSSSLRQTAQNLSPSSERTLTLILHKAAKWHLLTTQQAKRIFALIPT